MRAYLIRHAEAVPRESDQSPRLLTDKGREDARRLGLFLKRDGVGRARVIHNGRSWVRENAEILAGILDEGNGASVVAPSYPLNAGVDIEPFIGDLNAASGDIVAALPNDVAHRVATRLIAGRETPYAVSMANGDAACVEPNGEGGWRLVWLVTATQLENSPD
ncbi:MAG: hypothetical protein R3229_01670 [Alphaproteobacteria bacterium]|nr:hypothetical protein [Alphaproteobacteria bacterium]